MNDLKKSEENSEFGNIFKIYSIFPDFEMLKKITDICILKFNFSEARLKSGKSFLLIFLDCCKFLKLKFPEKCLLLIEQLFDKMKQIIDPQTFNFYFLGVLFKIDEKLTQSFYKWLTFGMTKYSKINKIKYGNVSEKLIYFLIDIDEDELVFRNIY